MGRDRIYDWGIPATRLVCQGKTFQTGLIFDIAKESLQIGISWPFRSPGRPLTWREIGMNRVNVKAEVGKENEVVFYWDHKEALDRDIEERLKVVNHIQKAKDPLGRARDKAGPRGRTLEEYILQR